MLAVACQHPPHKSEWVAACDWRRVNYRGAAIGQIASRQGWHARTSDLCPAFLQALAQNLMMCAPTNGARGAMRPASRRPGTLGVAAMLCDDSVGGHGGAGWRQITMLLVRAGAVLARLATMWEGRE